MIKKRYFVALFALSLICLAVAPNAQAVNPSPCNSFSAVEAGGLHNVGVKLDGSLWAWGFNSKGQLGEGTTTNRSAPTRIGTNTDWTALTSGFYHSAALRANGSLWTWGDNDAGQLGYISTLPKLAPTRVGTGTDWAAISSGYYHTAALKTDGSLWAWGGNSGGQLGDGTTTDKSTPTQIGTETNWTIVTAGGFHTVAIKTDGSLWAWGRNDKGQLGDGTTTDKSLPTRIGIDNDWVLLSANGFHTIAIKTGGSLWAWGGNNNGQLGDGTTTDKSTPTRIGTGNDWSFIATGGFHTVAIKTDGSLWAWGYNYFGQIGDGTTTTRTSPARMGIETDWVSATAGYHHTVANKTDGSLWAWGFNYHGQLGDGTIALRKTTPVNIEGGCIESGAIAKSISSPDDDAEEYWNCEVFNNCTNHPNGLIKLNSSDLDMGHVQMKYVGLRFQNMSIPRGAVITSAYLELTGDEANSADITLRIRCEDADNAAPFSNSPFNIGSRSKTSADIFWSPGAWVVGQTYQSDNFAASIQEVTDRAGWNPGNAIAILITRSVGDDVRAAVSYDNDPSAAAVLHVEYQYVSGIFDDIVDTSNGDAEEYWNCEKFNNCTSHPNGLIKLASPDLDMGHEQVKYVGIRFENLDIPQGATVTNAYIEFVSSEADNGEITLRIRCEDADNSAPFSNSPFNIGSRSKTSADTLWSPVAWVVGQTDQSDNFAASVQEVLDRGGWNSGNALAVLITRSFGDESGYDVRAAVSYDTDPDAAPILHIEYEVP